jgi:hypothetical protein
VCTLILELRITGENANQKPRITILKDTFLSHRTRVHKKQETMEYLFGDFMLNDVYGWTCNIGNYFIGLIAWTLAKRYSRKTLGAGDRMLGSVVKLSHCL